MPRASVWLVRTALVFLGAGLTAGAVLLAGRGLEAGPWLARLLPVHAEFLLVGWTIQLVLGVAYWILPLVRDGAERGREGLTWAAYGAFNSGVLLAALGAALGAPPALTLGGRLLESVGAGALAIQAWPRIRRPREVGCSGA